VALTHLHGQKFVDLFQERDLVRNHVLPSRTAAGLLSDLGQGPSQTRRPGGDATARRPPGAAPLLGMTSGPNHEISARDLDEMLVPELGRSPRPLTVEELAAGITVELVEDWISGAQVRGLLVEDQPGRWSLSDAGYRYCEKLVEEADQLSVGIPDRGRDSLLARLARRLRRAG
jgi:hypothetical protein